MCVALRQTVAVRYSTSVTYRTLCHASVRLVILGVFYLALLPAFFELPWGQKFNLKVSRASCWSSKHSPVRLFVWITTIQKKFIYGSLYLRARAGQSRNIILYRELVLWNISFEIFACYGILTPFTTGKHVTNLLS